MKISQFLLLCVSTIILASCTSFGKKYALDKDHNVYYKGDGVDESAAKKVADLMKARGYFTDGMPSDLQITKTKDTYNVNFVSDKSKMNAEQENLRQQFGAMISAEVFGGAPVNVNLCDEHMEIFKTLPMAKSTPVETAPVETNKEATEHASDSSANQ